MDNRQQECKKTKIINREIIYSSTMNCSLEIYFIFYIYLRKKLPKSN